jgi:hypothetical protein
MKNAIVQTNVRGMSIKPILPGMSLTSHKFFDWQVNDDDDGAKSQVVQTNITPNNARGRRLIAATHLLFDEISLLHRTNNMPKNQERFACQMATTLRSHQDPVKDVCPPVSTSQQQHGKQ